MTIRYLEDGLTPVYRCAQAYHQFGEPTCQTIRGDGIDAAVAQTFLAAMQPAQLGISLATLDQLEAQARQIEEQGQRRLERVRYEADLSRRRLFAVDPENRLVARNLERDWNEKLAEVEPLERAYLTLTLPPALVVTPEERERILALAQNLPAIWQADTTTYTERKQLLRFLIKDVTLARQDTPIQIGIRWQTEALTELEIPRPKSGAEEQRTDPTVVARVRELAPIHTDRQIATLLVSARVWPMHEVLRLRLYLAKKGLNGSRLLRKKLPGWGTLSLTKTAIVTRCPKKLPLRNIDLAPVNRKGRW
jgi:hypothetical protein